jgi:nucleolar protein 53
MALHCSLHELLLNIVFYCRGKIKERSNDNLFMIDVKGDDRVKRQLAKDKPLYIDKVLQSRSAIPAVGTRLFSIPKAADKEKGKESRANREKIEKMAKRKLTNPAPAKPAKKSKGTAYNVWADEGKLGLGCGDYSEKAANVIVVATVISMYV